MAVDPEQASRAIHATREGLAAAGYSIEVSARDEALVFSVRAEEGACEECLVPKAIFVDILGRELEEAGVQAGKLEVLYPLDGE